MSDFLTPDLSRPRQSPYSLKCCLESIGDLEQQARELVASIEKAGREPTAAEARHFDGLCEQVKNWRQEEKLARAFRQQVLDSATGRREEVLT